MEIKPLSTETIALLYFLLPGFVARWVFHGLTAHKRAEAFERVIEALIFTVIVQAIIPPLRDSLLRIGQHVDPAGKYLLAWHESYQLTYSFIVSLVVGVVFAGFANNDFFHRWLRNRYLWLLRHPEAEKWSWKSWRWTKRTSMPTQWYSMFSKLSGWMALELADGRRLYGYATEWPDHPDDGHFAMQYVEWLVGDERQPAENNEAILVPVKDVKMVQFAATPIFDPQSKKPNLLTSCFGWITCFGRTVDGNRSSTTTTAQIEQATATIGPTTGTQAITAASTVSLDGRKSSGGSSSTKLIIRQTIRRIRYDSKGRPIIYGPVMEGRNDGPRAAAPPPPSAPPRPPVQVPVAKKGKKQS